MIFVDTSFWVAIRNRRDNSHDLARAILASHPAEPLLTGNHVRGEPGHSSAAEPGSARQLTFSIPSTGHRDSDCCLSLRRLRRRLFVGCAAMRSASIRLYATSFALKRPEFLGDSAVWNHAASTVALLA